MSKIKPLSLRTKMFITFGTAYVVLISIIGIVIYVSNFNEMKSQTKSLSKVLSTQFTRTIDLYFEDIERLSLIIFTDSQIQESLDNYETNKTGYDEVVVRNHLYPRLFNQMYPRKDIQRISIYTNNGTAFEYERSAGIEVTRTKKKPDWQLKLDELPKSSFLFLPTHELELSNNRKTKVVSLVRNIYNIPNREKIGSMKIDVHIEVFTRLLDLENVNEFEEHARVFLLSEDSSVVYDHQNSLTGIKLIDLDISQEHSDQKKDTLLWRDNQFLFSNKYSKYTMWNTVILIDDDFLIYERNQIILFVGISGIIAIAIIALVSYLLSFQISRPLVKMMERMRRVERGDLRDRMPLTGNKEMDLLTRVYNNMLNSINKLITEVYELTIAEKNSKISALQSQINPHFLYNTLNIMKAISRLKGVEEVAEISESLSDLFKYSMKDFDKSVPLQKELDHISNYMNIQRYRFGERYQYIEEVSNRTKGAYIPKLIIQPLIENAINHGLSQSKNGGTIHLTTEERDNVLLIRVMDNGVGMDEQYLYKVNTEACSLGLIEFENQGIGLMNIQQRIQLMYGYKYGLDIQSQYHKGTSVTLRLPFHIERI